MTGRPAQAIDLVAATLRVGDRAMLLRVLARFRDAYRGMPAAIGDALAQGDTETARRLAHSLKGAAGMIEAKALQAAALDLEQALGPAGGDCSTPLARLRGELDRVLVAIDALAG